MYLWLTLSCLTLVLNNVIMEPQKFEFSHMTLGHSGFLIFWKSNTTPDESISDLQFRFGYRIKDAKNTNFSFPKSNSPLATSTDQYKIGSLQENTLYEVLIQQHFGSSELETDYKYLQVLEMNTSRKINAKPAKPDFDWVFDESIAQVRLRWFPCGRDRNCDGKEAGTHFAIKVSVLDRKEEIEVVEMNSDFLMAKFFMPGIWHEVVVISINNDFKTDSEPQEIFLQPKFSAVRSVNVISFPNASIQVSWKPPQHSLDKLIFYEVYISVDNFIFFKFQSKNSRKAGIDLPDAYIVQSTEKLIDIPKYQLKPGDTYIISIIPVGLSGKGFRYSHIQSNVTSLVFEEFKTWRTKIWRIDVLVSEGQVTCCTCPFFVRKNQCKHSVSMLIRRKDVQVQPEAKTVPLGQKRKRGQPSKAIRAILVQ